MGSALLILARGHDSLQAEELDTCLHKALLKVDSLGFEQAAWRVVAIVKQVVWPVSGHEC